MQSATRGQGTHTPPGKSLGLDTSTATPENW
jgi:hypothetical protein